MNKYNLDQLVWYKSSIGRVDIIRRDLIDNAIYDVIITGGARVTVAEKDLEPVGETESKQRECLNNAQKEAAEKFQKDELAKQQIAANKQMAENYKKRTAHDYEEHLKKRKEIARLLMNLPPQPLTEEVVREALGDDATDAMRYLKVGDYSKVEVDEQLKKKSNVFSDAATQIRINLLEGNQVKLQDRIRIKDLEDLKPFLIKALEEIDRKLKEVSK